MPIDGERAREYRAAHQWGRIDISYPMIDFVLEFQDPHTGGFSVPEKKSNAVKV